MDVLVKQATEADIPVIERILAEAVARMDAMGQHQWEYKNVRWEALAHFYNTPANFYIAYANDEPAACMALVDHDPAIWQGIPAGESLYIHKLAVRPAFAGQGLSRVLVDFAKDMAQKRGITTLRLDTHRDRPKVRAVYEKQGFVCVEETILFGKYATALYVCTLA